MAWRWCSRVDRTGRVVTRCWNPTSYQGPWGERLCEEHARLLVRERGMTALRADDRERFLARNPEFRTRARVDRAS